MRKNFFFTIIILLIVNFVSAQNTRVGFFGGPVWSNMYQKVNGVKHNSDYVTGATAGILLDVPMQRYGSFQPGFNFITKNSKDEFVSNGETVKTKTQLSYLEVPINVLFRVPAGSGKFTVGGGVAAAVAIAGKRQTSSSMSNDNKKLNFGDETRDDYGRYDFGLNGLAGYEFANSFFVTLNYNFGINRLFVGGNPDDKLYNRYFALRVGFLFGGKK